MTDRLEDSGRPDAVDDDRLPRLDEGVLHPFFPWERGPGYGEGFGEFRQNVSLAAVLTGTIPVIVLVFTVGAVFISLLLESPLTQTEMISWIAIVFIMGGIISMVLVPYYKVPVVGAWSIPGMFLVMEALDVVSYQEAVGAFLLSGILVFLLGVTQSIRKLLTYIPLSVLTAMVAGVLLTFPLRIIEGFEASLVIGVAGVLGFVVFNAVLPRVPGIFGTILFGVIAALATGEFGGGALNFALARLTVPGYAFSVQAFLSITIPLSILVIGAENMQAAGILRSLGAKPPINAMTMISGIAGVITSIFGGHDANIAGPTTATCASPQAGPLRGRYTAGILAGVVFIVYGITAPMMVDLVGLIPGALTNVLVGIVILPVVGRALITTFAGPGRPFVMASMTSLIVAVSGLTIFGISSAFWALVFGTAVAMTVERADYVAHIKDKEAAVV